MRSLSVLFLCAVLAACASPQEKEAMVKKKMVDSRLDMQFVDQPDWFMNPPFDEDIMYGVGTSGLSNQGAAIQQAKLAAMAELAQQISAVVDNLSTSTFTGQESSLGTVEKGVFQNASKAIASAPLRGVTVVRRQSVRSENGVQTYVMVKLTKADAARSAAKQIESLDKEIMETNTNLLSDLDAAIKQRL